MSTLRAWFASGFELYCHLNRNFIAFNFFSSRGLVIVSINYKRLVQDNIGFVLNKKNNYFSVASGHDISLVSMFWVSEIVTVVCNQFIIAYLWFIIPCLWWCLYNDIVKPIFNVAYIAIHICVPTTNNIHSSEDDTDSAIKTINFFKWYVDVIP